jgi:hypothetical protein
MEIVSHAVRQTERNLRQKGYAHAVQQMKTKVTTQPEMKWPATEISKPQMEDVDLRGIYEHLADKRGEPSETILKSCSSLARIVWGQWKLEARAYGVPIGSSRVTGLVCSGSRS